MLIAKDIHKNFGGVPVLKGVSLSVQKGEVVALIGPSGGGKSTFLRCLNQLERVDRGDIRLDGIPMCETVNGRVRYAPPKQLRLITRRMGMVFQSFNLFPHLSVLDNLTEAQRCVLRRSSGEAIQKARALLEKVGLSDKEREYPFSLSGGQAQRVAIARALCMDPEILCFDEPTSALDPSLTQEVLAVMRTLAAENMTMIVVTHEMRFARDVADRVVYMQNGVIKAEGAPDAVFAPDNSDVRAFIGTAFENG